MKVGLNATCLNDRPSGARQRFIGIYRELVNCLPEAEFVIYEPADCQIGSWFGGASNISVRRTPLPSEGRARKFISGLAYWGTTLRREKFDIFEGFNLPLVKPPTGRTLLTIYDIRGLHPEYGALERTVFKTFLGKSLRAADHVVTDSAAMKEEILHFFPEVPISVVYNGIDSHVFDDISASAISSVSQKFALPQEFILAVGHLERRKNYLRLIDAIACLRNQGRSCFLVIIGNDSGLRKEIEDRAESANLSSHLKILSGLSDLEVRCAYKLCSMFVFPSSYEGFGIPVLEAMAAGCPMALSDIPVFREITANRGVYFPHHDPEAMASAIEEVLTSSRERKRQIQYGYERVQDFNFKNLAGQMASLYKKVING